MTSYGLMRKRPDERDYAFAPPDRWDGSTEVDLAGLFPGHVWFPTDEVDNGDSSDFWVVTTMEDPGAPTPPGPAPDYGPLVTAVEATRQDAAVMRWLGAWHCCTTRRAADRLKSIINALPED